MIVASIIVIALVTYLIRLLPFLIFGGNKRTPEWINYLGRYLPPAVMGMLIVYSIKDTSLLQLSASIPVAVAISATILIHVWKRNNLLSILGGTGLYMFLIG
jgi:branched-subunit amino acid transport protein AzlD